MFADLSPDSQFTLSRRCNSCVARGDGRDGTNKYDCIEQLNNNCITNNLVDDFGSFIDIIIRSSFFDFFSNDVSFRCFWLAYFLNCIFVFKYFVIMFSIESVLKQDGIHINHID